VPNQQSTGADLEKAREAIQRLSPDRLCIGKLLDLRDALPDIVRGVVSAVIDAFLGGGLVRAVSATIEALAGRSLRQLLMKWGIVRNETVECLKNIVNTAKEASQYIDDERLRDVVEEVAKKWGWDVDIFKRFVKTAAGKTITEDEEVKKMIKEALEKIEKELNEVKTKVEGLLVGAKVFYIYDVENGLLYGNFIVEGGVPRIRTRITTSKEELVTDLVNVGRFREVAEGVFSRLVKDGRVVLIGPRGIGKSTLATYVAWRSLLGGLGNVVLNEQLRDAVIHIESLKPGDAARLNKLVKATGRRFVVIYDPSPIEAYYKPETMQVVKHDIESVENTLRELMEVGNAWVVIILPRELYDEVSKDVALRSILDEIRDHIINVDLRDGEFLREVIRKYSGCDDVSDGLVKGVMGFDSYTLVAKYVGIWLRERGCGVEDINDALMRSAGEPKLFFAHYIWGIILGKSVDLAKRISVPLILHAVFGPIPEGITYITKAVNEGGVWRLIDRDRITKSELEDLREADLEPIAKWLSTLHEDLIEETLEELTGLRGDEPRKHYIDHGFEDFIKALDWGYEKALEEVRGLSRETKPEEVVTNLLIFVSERLKNALKPYTNYWKRTALIIGHALAGHPIVPRPKDLPESLRGNVAGSLGDALNRCEIDDYLLVGNEIPPLVWYLIENHAYALTEAFVDKYNEAVDEVRRVLGITRDRGNIHAAEEFYGLGLASIIAKAVEPGKPVDSSDADVVLRLASFAIQRVVSADLIVPILRILESLRGKAPQRYIELLVPASFIENLDLGTVRYIFDELNGILDNYGDVVKGYAWSLIHAIIAYANLLGKHRSYFNREEVGDVVGRVVDLLNELGRFKSSLGVIAWAIALAPALGSEYVRVLMEKALGIDVVRRASGVLGELSRLRGLIQELMGDKEFMSYIESKSVKADEEAVRRLILNTASFLRHALAQYRLDNDELDKVEELFNEAAEENKEIGEHEGYLIDRGLALRVEAIKGSLLVDEFGRLYEEAFNAEYFKPTAEYLSTASTRLGDYLVSLALTGNYETMSKLPEEHWQVLNADKEASVLTRLALNALLRPRGELNSELKGRLSVEHWELINAFGYEMRSEFLPALMVAFGIAKPEDGAAVCMLINDSTKGMDCVYAISVAINNYIAVVQLRGWLIDTFRELLFEKLGLLKVLGVDADALFNEFMKLVSGLDGKSLVHLIASRSSMARLALMLHALINGNKELAKAHALYGAVNVSGKLLTRLFLEAYGACCDLGSEEFRRAIARLFFYHV
jgi:hypothetical protein